MPRAHRTHVDGYLWHLTHRCHGRRFLLRFARDRRAWRHWLFEACQRYGLCVLDYTATSNHVHLLVRDQGRGEIAASMQLIEGRTAQRFNRRKARAGAFWGDRYHATAVEAGEHLARCLVYIDLNMVRAGAVEHPVLWEVGGFHEIQCPPARYRIVDRVALADVLGVRLLDLAETHREWIELAMRRRQQLREPHWSEAVAVGGLQFVERVQNALAGRGRYRQIEGATDVYVLREPAGAYGRGFKAEHEPSRVCQPI
jgi:putative transposase